MTMTTSLCSICKTYSGDFHNINPISLEVIQPLHEHTPYKCPVRRCGKDLDIVEKKHVQDGTGEVAHMIRCDNGHRFFITRTSSGPRVGINMHARRR